MSRWSTQPADGCTQCLLSPAVEESLATTPGYPCPPVLPPSPMHRVGPSVLGGQGMFATRPIKQGDLILSERALLIVPAEMRYTTDGVETLKGVKKMRGILRGAEKQLETLLRRMDRQDQTKYLSLANVHKKDGSGPLLGILRTNGYCIDGLREPGVNGNAGAYSGVFNELSRVNHICCPNSTRRFHMPSFSMRLYAIRDIAEGEEITTNYTGTWESTVARQEKLLPYGFTCSCPCCSNCEASDQRRARLQEQFNPRRLSMRLNKWVHTQTSGITNEEMTAEVEEGLRLYAEEGLESHNLYPTFLLHVCSVLSAMGIDFRKYSLILLRLWIVRGMNLGKMFAIFQMLVLPLYRLRYLPDLD